MSITTLDLQVVNDKAASVYEAVLIISKRARAITAERKAREILYEGSFDTTDEMVDVEEEIEIQENPVVVAMENFFEDKLSVAYKTDEEESEISDSDKALQSL